MANPHQSTKPKTTRSPIAIWRPAFLEALANTANVTIAAQAAGIDRTTAYKARRRSPRFAEAWDAAINEAVDLLEAEARRRAFEGVQKPVYYKGEEVGYIREYSDTLMIFLLKAHRPEKFRDNFRVEHAMPEGQTAPPQITIVFEDDPDRDPEALAESDDDILDADLIEPEPERRQLGEGAPSEGDLS